MKRMRSKRISSLSHREWLVGCCWCSKKIRQIARRSGRGFSYLSGLRGKFCKNNKRKILFFFLNWVFEIKLYNFLFIWGGMPLSSTLTILCVCVWGVFLSWPMTGLLLMLLRLQRLLSTIAIASIAMHVLRGEVGRCRVGRCRIDTWKA